MKICKIYGVTCGANIAISKIVMKLGISNQQHRLLRIYVCISNSVPPIYGDPGKKSHFTGGKVKRKENSGEIV